MTASKNNAYIRECDGKCGRLCQHYSGKCRECRKINCKKCGKEFIPKIDTVGMKCSKCANHKPR